MLSAKRPAEAWPPASMRRRAMAMTRTSSNMTKNRSMRATSVVAMNRRFSPSISPDSNSPEPMAAPVTWNSV